MLKLPKYSKLTRELRDKILIAAADNSYRKAGKIVLQNYDAISASTVYRTIKNTDIYIHYDSFERKPDDIVHVQIDEKYLRTTSKDRKIPLYTLSIFTGKTTKGTKCKRSVLINKSIFACFSNEELLNELKYRLIYPYSVKNDEKIFVSGDLAPYIKKIATDEITYCEVKYIPDKYHVLSLLKKITGFPKKYLLSLTKEDYRKLLKQKILKISKELNRKESSNY